MFTEITIGQYYPADSVLHRMDPRVKVAGTFLFIVCLFVVNSFPGYLLCALFLAAVIALSKVPFRFILRGMRPVLFLLALTVVFNLLFTPGEPIFQWWRLSITREGVEFAVKMGMRLTLLILGSTLMTLTTTPNQLTDAMETLLAPLKKLRIPVHEIAMMMSIALRFIPILMEETDKIMKAQIARGADFESGRVLQRVRGMIPLLVPLFISAFRRANDLALAMEARCYHGGEGRTRMHPLVYDRTDRLAYACLWGMVALCILMRVLHI